MVIFLDKALCKWWGQNKEEKLKGNKKKNKIKDDMLSSVLNLNHLFDAIKLSFCDLVGPVIIASRLKSLGSFYKTNH